MLAYRTQQNLFLWYHMKTRTPIPWRHTSIASRPTAYRLDPSPPRVYLTHLAPSGIHQGSRFNDARHKKRSCPSHPSTPPSMQQSSWAGTTHSTTSKKPRMWSNSLWNPPNYGTTSRIPPYCLLMIAITAPTIWRKYFALGRRYAGAGYNGYKLSEITW